MIEEESKRVCRSQSDAVAQEISRRRSRSDGVLTASAQEM